MSQAELGKILNITQQTVNHYETGKRKPDQDMLANIANYFNVSIDWIIGRSPIRTLSIPDPNIEKFELREGVNPDELPPEKVKEIYDALENLQNGIDALKKSLSKRVND